MGRKISAGDILVTNVDVIADSVSSGSIVVSAGQVVIESLSSGGAVIAGESVEIKNGGRSAECVSSPEIAVESGDVDVVSVRAVFNPDVGKLSEDSVSSSAKWFRRRLKENSKYEEAKNILNVGDGGLWKEQEETIEYQDIAERIDKEEMRNAETQRLESDNSKDSSEDNDDSTLVDSSISDRDLAIVIVAEVLGLLSEENEQYNRDRRILLEQYPELKNIFERAESVENALEMSNSFDELEFTEQQKEIMRQYRDICNSEDASVEELVY